MISLTEFLGFLAVLLGGAIIGGALAYRLRQPVVLGFLLVGIAIGPHGFSLIGEVEEVNLLAEFGTVVLLFVVGLEFNLERLRKVGGTAMTIGLVELSTVFSLGYLVGYSIGWSVVESMFLAGILAISSTSICIRMLKDMKLTQTREAEVVVGTLIVEDLAAVLILVLLSDITRSGGINPFATVMLTLQTIAFFVLSLGFGLMIVPKILDAVNKLNIEEAPFLTALSLGFSMAFFANLLGFSTAVGAFLMGVMISSAPKSGPIIGRILPLRDFFATIFFVSVGMLVDPRLILEFAILSIPIVIIAVFGKIFGNFLGSVVAGLRADSAATIGVAMVPRGEFSYIIAKHALDLGVVKAAMYPATIIVSFVTALITPLMMRVLPTITVGTIVPERVFLPLVYVGALFRQIQRNIDRRGKIFRALRMRIFRVLIDVVLIVTILTAVGTLRPYLADLHAAFPVLSIISLEVFVLLVTAAMLAYPILSIFGEVGGLTQVFVQVVTDRITFSRHPRTTVYRVIRNVLFAQVLLLLASFITPIVALVSGLAALAPIIYLSTFVVLVLLILDAFLTIHREIEKILLKAIAARGDEDQDSTQGNTGMDGATG